MLSVGMTGFEPATTRPPDAYSNRAELHPVFSFNGCKGRDFILNSKTFPIKIHRLQDLFLFYMLIDTYISYLS